MGAKHVFTILVIEDDPDFAETLQEFFDIEGYTTRFVQSLKQASIELHSGFFHVVLSDIHLPDGDATEEFVKLKHISPLSEFVLMSSYTNVKDAVATMRKGAFMYVEKDKNIDGLLLIVERAAEKVDAQLSLKSLIDNSKTITGSPFDSILGHSEAISRCLDKAKQSASTDLPILLFGETGTGKELFAAAIHQASSRQSRSLVSVNCSALPQELFESELFGFCKGAFSGALHDKKGLFDTAHGSTLFLDEIGELPLQLQPKLLRVLETKEFRHLGSTDNQRSDFRLICATNRHLHDEVRRNTFRADLLYRIEGITITIPPLRERVADITLLAKYFLAQANHTYKKNIQGLSADLRQLLIEHPWHGNIRELRNCIQYMSVFCNTSEIHGDLFIDFLANNGQVQITASTTDPASSNLPSTDLTAIGTTAVLSLPASQTLPASTTVSGNTPLSSSASPALARATQQTEKELIIDILMHNDWHLAQTAQALGINYTTLYRKMKKYNIRRQAKPIE